jgi:hypothetical protein
MAQVKGTRSLAELPTPPGLPLLGQSIQIVRYGVELVSSATALYRILLPQSTSLQFTAARLITASALDVARYQY